MVWTATAIADLRAVRDYIAGSNPQAAQSVGRDIAAAAVRLAELPSMGRPGRVPNTREGVIPGLPLIVAYTVDEDRVVVVAVMHGARRWPDAFETR